MHLVCSRRFELSTNSTLNHCKTELRSTRRGKRATKFWEKWRFGRRGGSQTGLGVEDLRETNYLFLNLVKLQPFHIKRHMFKRFSSKKMLICYLMCLWRLWGEVTKSIWPPENENQPTTKHLHKCRFGQNISLFHLRHTSSLTPDVQTSSD